MKERKLLILLLIVFISACSSIPDWYLNPPSDSEHLYAARTAVSSDMQIALDKAAMEARAELARQLQTKIMEIQKKFVEEIGETADKELNRQFSKATKSVVNTMLHGSRVKEQKFFEEENHWRAYVLVELPWNEARQKFIDNIAKDKILYEKVKNTNTFENLVKEAQEK